MTGPTSPAPAIAVRELSVRFGGLAAISELHFDVAAGSIKAVIGPNGAGKTTLFNVISGIQAPADGRVLLDGDDLAGVPAHRRVERGLARTFQNLQIFQDMSVLENVMVGRHARSTSGVMAALLRSPASRREERRIAAEAMAVLTRLGLGARAHDPVTQLPFGDLKVLEIARALASEPRVLLLDEPMAGLPHGETGRLCEVIEAIAAGGVTVLLVEHNMGVVMRLAHEILVLNFGRWIAEGTPSEVRRHPDVIAAYLGADAVAS